MFLKKRKPAHPSEGESAEPSTVKDSTLKNGKPAQNTAAEKKDPLVVQISNLEELVNKRTKDLEEAKRQLVQLHDSGEDRQNKDNKDAKVEQLFSQPNQTKAESKPSAQPQAAQPVEMKAATPPQKADTGEAKKENKETDSQSLDLFSNEEVEENPLAGLITSLPNVTAEELIKEVQEVTTMLRECRADKEEK